VTYVYTEQMRTIQRNAFIIWAKLNAIKAKRHLHIDLDIDDYLHPRETIDRHMMGIDMQFMVEHVGGPRSFCDTTESAVHYKEIEVQSSDEAISNNQDLSRNS
jgi:hypothetical protein